MIIAMANDMIFAEGGVTAPRMKLVKSTISKITERQLLDEREGG